ncbi:MAG: AMP-binding protein [Pseudonocardiaceae bacterium]
MVQLDIGGPRVDDLLGRAARSASDHTALRTPQGEITYAQLDDRVSRCAVAIRRALGETTAVVGLAAVLDTTFAVAYYGIARSGNVIAIVNPLLPEDSLVHVLGISRARAVIVPPTVYWRLRFLVDRLKDVFKCDNELVAPTEIERVLQRHPEVADCVVVDYPDEFSGAVAYALVVPRDGTADPAEIVEFVNNQVPYYQRLRHVELRERIPRSPDGKIPRRELREQVRARRMPS